MPNLKRVLYVVAPIIIFASLGFTGEGDQEEEIRQGDLYCEMVEAGGWEDYNDSIKCGEE